MKFPDFSLTGKCLAIFPGFPVSVGTINTALGPDHIEHLLQVSTACQLHISNGFPKHFNTKTFILSFILADALFKTVHHFKFLSVLAERGIVTVFKEYFYL